MVDISVAQAQLLILAAQYQAAWLGGGKTVNRDAGGRFASSAAVRRVAQKCEGVDLDDATQKEIATLLETAEFKEWQKELGNRVARLGDKGLFDEVVGRLARALKTGQLHSELKAILEKYPNGIEVFAAIAFALENEELVGTMIEAVPKQEEKNLLRDIQNR